MSRSRRTSINVWPGIADLMTLLVVVQVSVIVGMTTEAKQLRARIEGQADDIHRLEEVIAAASPSPKPFPAALKSAAREAALNNAMFAAIQAAQRIVDDVAAEAGIEVNPDQSIQFGEDLVEFDRNGLEPQWRSEGQDRLRRFCQGLDPRMSQVIPGLGLLRDLIAVQVEGHTDSTICPPAPHCNWSFSANRAVAFAVLMRDSEYCPGGESWDLRPVGLADTHPLVLPGGGTEPTRRVTLRLQPKYEAIIAKRGAK